MRSWRFELHRALRGRYRLASALAVVGAVTGGIIGFHSQVPLYKSEGMIRIASEFPAILGRNDLNERKSILEKFLTAQEKVIKSHRVLENAMDHPVWKATGRGNDPALVEKFADQLTVEHPLRTELLRISFMDPDPNAAAAAVNAVINAYQSVYADEETNAQTRQVNAEGKLGSRLSVENSGNTAISPFKDGRTEMGALGALVGAMLPLVGTLLFSLAGRRYQVFDEGEEEAANAPLLGILPTLPEHLDDPEQAAVAAHCIHQIRAMLQLGGQNGSRSVYMITSSTAGDGKTSLTMALGLSFAAAGSRTLVVDFDMAGQGLTHRLKASPSTGIVEVLLSGSVLGNIIKTQTENLSLLPVGNTEAFDACLCSPSSVRHLIAEARKSYDIVIVDSGPILGSLEASVVASEVDGVILAVARGQHRHLVQRSLRHLRSVGANIAGIVFNRAKPRDFDGSHASA